MNITKPSITRLARCAGVKSVSEECFVLIRSLINTKLEEIVRITMLVNSEHHTKTLMSDDIYDSISFSGVNLTQSSDIGVSTCSK
jgi:histone H3/H4